MALSATCVFEVRTTGSDTNGGGFDPGVSSPGTDFSQQNAAQVAYTDLVIGSTNTQLTSSANPFSSTSPGNFINITGGSGFTTGWYEILSVSGSTATMDRAVGTASSTGGTGNLGGAFASPGQVASIWVGSNTMYIKKGTFSLSSTQNVSGGRVNVNPSGATTSAPNRIYGYNTNRTATNTDVGPTLQPSAGSMTCIYCGSGSVIVYNVLFAANGQSNCTALQFDNNPCVAEACQVTGAFSFAFNNSFSTGSYINCYVNGAATGFSLRQNSSSCRGCVATGCTSSGFSDNGISGARYVRCIAANNSGYGFFSAQAPSEYDQCTSDNNSGANGHGFSGTDQSKYFNCLSTNNAKFGFTTNQSGTNQLCRIYNCAGFNNSSGNVDTTFGVNESFVTLSAGPYNNAGGGDYSLNSTSGGGTACKGTGFIQSYPGISTNSSFNIGAVQNIIIIAAILLSAPGIAAAETIVSTLSQGYSLSRFGPAPVPIIQPPPLTVPVTEKDPSPFPAEGTSYTYFGKIFDIPVPPFVPPTPPLIVVAVGQVVPVGFPTDGISSCIFGKIPTGITPPSVLFYIPPPQYARFEVPPVLIDIRQPLCAYAVFPGPITSSIIVTPPGTYMYMPTLACPIDRENQVLLSVVTNPGGGWSYMTWQCLGEPSHNGILPIDPAFATAPNSILGQTVSNIAISGGW